MEIDEGNLISKQVNAGDVPQQFFTEFSGSLIINQPIVSTAWHLSKDAAIQFLYNNEDFSTSTTAGLGYLYSNLAGLVLRNQLLFVSACIMSANSCDV